MPSPLTMRRIIASGTQKSGPPTRGLQGIWFLGRNNLLLDPSDLTSASFSVGAVTKTSATRITETTANTYHYVYQQVTTLGSVPYTYYVDVQAGSMREWAWLIIGSVANACARFNLTAGTVGTVSGAFSPTAAIEDRGGGVLRLSIKATPSAGTTTFGCGLGIDDSTITYAGDTGATLNILRQQVQQSATAYPFEDRGTQQTLPIYRGTAGTLQRGATTGAEATDPGLRNNGLLFDTDDYVLGQNLSNVTMAGNWTAYIVGLFNGTMQYPFSIAASISDYVMINSNASGQARAVVSAAGSASFAIAVAVSTTSPICLVLSGSGGVATLRRMDTGVSASTVAKSPTGTPKMSVGSLYGSYPVDAMTGHAVALFNVVHNAAERARTYAWLKSELAKPPYGLAVL